MRIDHIHFCVDDAIVSRDWFIKKLGFQPLAQRITSAAHTEIIRSGDIYFVLSSPKSPDGEESQYLQHHPPGVFDVAFTVADLDRVLQQALAAGAQLLQPIQVHVQAAGYLRWAQIAAWGDMRHTLIERSGLTSLLPGSIASTTPFSSSQGPFSTPFSTIDHVVLNVGSGELLPALQWYEAVLGFKAQQSFSIQTQYSGLDSRVLVHPDGMIQFPINQPTSCNSQIQEFLDLNGGVGIQHIALKTSQLLQVMPQLRDAGLTFLPVVEEYYDRLQQAFPGLLSQVDWEKLLHCQVLIDRQSEEIPALLLQVFTKPIFREPTFFLELIERQTYYSQGQLQQVEGFGNRNFQALFEAMEQEQQHRQSLANH